MMDESIELLSSMSPRIKSKHKYYKKGATLLALKKHIRRSSLLNNSVRTIKNKNLCIVESNTNTDSSHSNRNSLENGAETGSCTDSLDSFNKKVLNETPIIVISDTDSESEIAQKTSHPNGNIGQIDNILPDTKINEIQRWIAKVNIENETQDDNTAFSEISSIHGDNEGGFHPKEKGTAVNSTFINSNCKPFNRLFRSKENSKVDNKSSETLNSEEGRKDSSSPSFKNVVIDDSFEILNDSLQTRLKIKDSRTDELVTNNMKSKCELNHKKALSEDCKDVDDPNRDFELMLDNLYGHKWREKQNLVLPGSERKINPSKPGGNFVTHSERKPKFSLLYKNPYLIEEKSKSNNLLQSLQRSRMLANSNSPWIAKLKVLCDSDSNSDRSSIENGCPRTQLNFDDSDECTTNKKKVSKYFDKINSVENELNEENFNISDLGQTLEERVKKKMNKIKEVPSNTKGADKSTKKMTDNRKKGLSDKENIDVHDDSAKRGVKGENVPGNTKITKSSTKKITKSSKDNNLGALEDSKKQIKDNETSKRYQGVSSADGDKSYKIKNNDSTNIKTVRPFSNGSSIDISSDEEWETTINKIKSRPTLVNGTYSFLSSLSGSVPISKCDFSARIYRSNFQTYKDELLKKLFALYNESIFDKCLDINTLLQWSDRMVKTAGYCYCKKITRRSQIVERSVRIVLSTKVIDSADRLRDTLVHEMCHAATWIVNCVSDGHGQYWKAWALKAMETFPELPPIKRCHDYVINTKYTYRCMECGYCIGRHTKSLDIERKRCGYCRGKFEVLLNKTTKKGETKSVPATPKKPATGFALFVKENYGIYKNSCIQHADVMKKLAQKFQEMKVNNK